MLNYCGYLFGQLLETFGLLFNLAFGHSVQELESKVGTFVRFYERETERERMCIKFLREWVKPRRSKNKGSCNLRTP